MAVRKASHIHAQKQHVLAPGTYNIEAWLHTYHTNNLQLEAAEYDYHIASQQLYLPVPVKRHYFKDKLLAGLRHNIKICGTDCGLKQRQALPRLPEWKPAARSTHACEFVCLSVCFLVCLFVIVCVLIVPVLPTTAFNAKQKCHLGSFCLLSIAIQTVKQRIPTNAL
ncbi:hypothetical protein ABBQ38_011684 [Trebouxia sp. C0009 RCD-2024]